MHKTKMEKKREMLYPTQEMLLLRFKDQDLRL